MLGYHVTERKSAKAILADGFLPGHGDVGFGVYFYGSLASARAYAGRGGWDGDLKDPVILMSDDPGIVEIPSHLLDPSWNPETYADMLWRESDEDTESDAPWRPATLAMADPGPFKVRRKK